MAHSLSVVLVAAGSGSRMQSDIPKQYIDLGGKPVICYSIQAFLDAFPETEIIIVVAPEFEPKLKEILNTYFPTLSAKIVYGGATRFDSCSAGVHAASQNIVMIHDAARPFIDKQLISNLYFTALEKGSAIPAVAPVESIRIVDENDQNKTIHRERIRLIQTPQAFNRLQLVAAYQRGFNQLFTDDASVWEAAGLNVCLIEGERENIKITTPQDLVWAKALLEAQNK